MTLTTYIERLRNAGALPAELLSARVESGCSDCGRRLLLDREISVRVCDACQAVSMAEDAACWVCTGRGIPCE